MAESLKDVEWLCFDVFGTVADWKGSMSAHMAVIAGEPASAGTNKEWQDRAQEWRDGFFKYIKGLKEGERNEGGMDEVHETVLKELLPKWGVQWDQAKIDEAVKGWHTIKGWPDSPEGLKMLSKMFTLTTLTNGDTAVLIKMAKHSDFAFDMHICGDSIMSYKPDPAMYNQAIRLSRVGAGRCAMVAAHAYDLDAAKKAGMRTIYIQRKTEDADQDLTPENCAGRFDLFITEEQGGLVGLAKELQKVKA